MSALRPLPPRPSLEFEHKEAKALLHRLRAGDPESLARARARHSAFEVEHIKLADAQLVIAREYGFTSWPKLVRYFEAVERQRHNTQTRHISGGIDSRAGRVHWLLGEAAQKAAWTARALAAYVPRFYGLQPDDIFAETITEDDARLAIARMEGSSSWETLTERVAEGNGSIEKYRGWEVDPMRRAWEAMRDANLDALRRIVEEHPELLRPSRVDAAKGRSLLRSALAQEQRQGRDAMEPIMDWLSSQGLDLEHEMNVWLCGFPPVELDDMRYLLDRGADPNWIAPNGFTGLEHALVRYWDSAKVDLVAARATPRKALWIAAGLGDADGVSRFLDRNGRPTQEARSFRPDFDAIGPITALQHPDPDDEEILTEALYVAALNGRENVIEYMASRGAPINGVIMGMPIVSLAVDRGNVKVVECLVRLGADVTLSGWRPGYSARDILRQRVVSNARDEKYYEMAKLCGLDPEAILAEYDARRVRPPGLDSRLQTVFELAGDDAFSRGETEIGLENIVFGLLRTFPPRFFAQLSGIDADQLHSSFVERLAPSNERLDRPKLPVHADAQAALQRAIAIADDRRRERVSMAHVIQAIAESEHGPLAELLPRYGGSLTLLRERLSDML